MHAEDGRRGNALQHQGLSRLLREVQGPRINLGPVFIEGSVNRHRLHSQALKGVLADPLKTSKNVRPAGGGLGGKATSKTSAGGECRRGQADSTIGGAGSWPTLGGPAGATAATGGGSKGARGESRGGAEGGSAPEAGTSSAAARDGSTKPREVSRSRSAGSKRAMRSGVNATSTVRSPSQGSVLCQALRASKRTGESWTS